MIPRSMTGNPRASRMGGVMPSRVNGIKTPSVTNGMGERYRKAAKKRATKKRAAKKRATAKKRSLSFKQKSNLPKKDFAVKSKTGYGGKGKYPIPDAAHARNALARVAQFGSPAEKAAVRAAVARKFPGIGRK